MVFGNLFKGRAAEVANKFSGNTDFLEGLCAGAALSAGAEGGIDDAEYDAALEQVRSNKLVAGAFDLRAVETTFGKMAPKTRSRSGRNELKNEIREVIARDRTGEMGEAIVLVMLDVADVGGISAEEEKVMREVADICGVNYDKIANG